MPPRLGLKLAQSWVIQLNGARSSAPRDRGSSAILTTRGSRKRVAPAYGFRDDRVGGEQDHALGQVPTSWVLTLGNSRSRTGRGPFS
jgi:hypothetical protein